MINDRGLPQLLSDLNGFIQVLLTSTASKAIDPSATESSSSSTPVSPTLIEDQNPHLLKICLYVEKILTEGLKDVNFIGKTHMFDFLENLPRCLPDTSRVIELAKDCCKTSLGRGRVVIRQALNEGSLEIYLSALCYNQSIIKSYYKETAYLRNSEFSSTFLTLLQSLEHIHFGLVVRDRDLDKSTYWDDITFILLRAQPTVIQIQSQTKLSENQQGGEEVVEKENQNEKNMNNSGELDINSLNSVLDEISKEEQEKLNNQILQANQLHWKTMIDSLSRASKALLLDYGGKGAPLSNQDLCIDGFFTVFDQLLSNDLLTSVLNRWICIEKLCESSLDVQQIQQIYNLTSQPQQQNTSLVLDTRVRAWVYKLLNDGTMTDVLKSKFTNENLLQQLYNANSIFHHYQSRKQIIDIISDLLSKVIFQLAWDKLEIQQPQQPNIITVTKKVKIIKKKIRKIKPTTDNDVEQTPTTSTNNNNSSTYTYDEPPQHLIDPSTPSIDQISEEKSSVISSSPPTSTTSSTNDLKNAFSSPSEITSTTSNANTNTIINDDNPFLTNIIQEQAMNNDTLNNLNNNNSSVNNPFLNDSIENTINSLSEDVGEETTNIEQKPTTSFDETLAELFKKQRIQSSSSSINLDQLEQAINDIDDGSGQTVTKAIPRSSLLSNSHIGEYLSTLVQDEGFTPPRSRSSSSASIPINIQDSNRYRSNSNQSGSGSGSVTSSRKSSHAGSVQANSNWNEDGAFPSYYRPVGGHEKEAFVTPTYIPNNPYLSEALRRVDMEKEEKSNNRMSSSVDSFANYHLFNDYYGENSPTPSPTRQSIRDKKNRYAGDDDQIFIIKEFKKPLLSSSETSTKFCPGCYNKLGFFKTRFCYYTGDWYCTTCHHNDKICLPSRILNHWDFKLYPICTQAKQYITQHYTLPIDIFSCNPKVYNLSLPLSKLLDIRKRLHFIGEYIETCRNKTALEGLCKNREYFVTENVHLYSLNDLELCFSGHLNPQIEALAEKYIHHVTISCNTCKGKGYICEFCNSDKLLFSWMVLDKQSVIQCGKCHSLAHKNCWIEGQCPKCIRISKIKAKHYTQNNDNNINNGSSINNNTVSGEDDANFYTGNNNNNNGSSGNLRYSMNKPFYN